MHDYPYHLLVGPLPYWETLGSYINAPYISSFIYPDALPSHNLEYFPPQTHQDLLATPGTTLAQMLEALKNLGIEPDALLWCDHKAPLPPDIHLSPIPTFLLVFDWHERYLALKDYAKAFDHVLGDRPLVQHLKTLGFEDVSQWYPYSFFPKLHFKTDLIRDLDISFAGRFSGVLYTERNAYLKRLLPLMAHYQVELKQRCYREDYNHLLNRSKIVFNHSIRGEMNQRAYEAPACGALLFMEESNLDIQHILPDGEGCVLYNADNFEDKLHYYLTHDAEREAIAARGHELIHAHTFEANFESVLAQVKSLMPHLPAQRLELGTQTLALNYLNLDQAHLTRSRATGLELLFHTVQRVPENPVLQNALAVSLLTSRQLKAPGVPENALQVAEQILTRLAQQYPTNPLIANNLAWVLLEQKNWDALFQRLGRNMLLLSQLPANLVQWQPLSGFVLPCGSNYFYHVWQKSWQQPNPQTLSERLIWNQLMLAGEYARQSGAFAKAVEVFTQASQLIPEVHTSVLQLGWAKLQVGDSSGYQDLLKGLGMGIFDLSAWELLLPLLLKELPPTEAMALRHQVSALTELSYFEPLAAFLE